MITYLFDFDGTLVNSMPTFENMFYKLFEENGKECDRELIKTITPLGYTASIKYILENTDLNVTKEQMVDFLGKESFNAYCYEIPAKDGVIETLKELKKRGVSLNVLTASPHVVLDPCLKRLGIYDIFDNVWSCDDYNSTKSDPTVYSRACKNLGLNEKDVIFVDDNIHAVRTAKKAGLTVYGIYDDSSFDSVEEMKKDADRYIYSFKELLI